MTMTAYDELLDHLESELAWFGEQRRAATVETFDYGEFLEAARAAYEDRDWIELQRIRGIDTYAHPLALEVARHEGWTGGDAEPIEIELLTGEEFVERLSAKTHERDW